MFDVFGYEKVILMEGQWTGRRPVRALPCTRCSNHTVLRHRHRAALLRAFGGTRCCALCLLRCSLAAADDMLISPDFYGYFAATEFLLDTDATVLCVSA